MAVERTVRMRVVMVAGLLLVCGWAWSQERVEVKRYEVGVTPQMASSVDSTLTAVAAQVPEAKALLEKVGSQAAGLVVLYYAQAVRRYTVIGAVLVVSGLLFAVLAACLFGLALRNGDNDDWGESVFVAGAVSLALLLFGSIYVFSPQYYAMRDVVNVLSGLVH